MKLSNALTTTHLKHLNPIRNTGQGVLQKKRHLLSSSAHTVHVIAPGQYQVLWYTLYYLVLVLVGTYWEGEEKSIKITLEKITEL